ncbi:MAG: hypothetical protein PHQ76_00015 [Caldisericia bacterium]|nr:hypothetical protein [Caldisericia bacterium]
MEKIKSILKTTKGLLIISIIASLSIGFLAGMEYKAHQVRTALKDAVEGITDIFDGENKATVTQEQRQE